MTNYEQWSSLRPTIYPIRLYKLNAIPIKSEHYFQLGIEKERLWRYPFFCQQVKKAYEEKYETRTVHQMQHTFRKLPGVFTNGTTTSASH
jgi:hypothetical protein